jgi:twinkle protein
MTMHERHGEWLTARGINPELAELMGVTTTRDHRGHWLTIPFIEGTTVVNHKYRLTSEKDHRMDPNAPLTFWNVNALSHPDVLTGAALVITEGEFDALSALSAGLRHVVSVPNGAPSRRTDEPHNAKRYEFIWRNQEALSKVRQFVLATDGDDAGRNLAADLVALLGPERCRFVTYPDGCKDLNDVAIKYGHPQVVDVVNAAKPYPIKGIYNITEFPEKGEVTSYPIGIDPLSEMIAVVPGTLTVMTGYANMGKSTVVNSIVANLLSLNIPVCIASFETEVKPILVNYLRASIARCSLHDAATKDMAKADEILAQNLSIITQMVDEDDEMDLEFFLDLCRTTVIRDGTKVIILDPWNELEHKRRRDENETDYISRALRQIKRFARQYDVAFWIIAHPTKPFEGRVKVPGLYDISGSANWANKADYGLTYHRKDPAINEAELRVTKVRMGLPGRKGSASVTYDFRTSEFVSLPN